MSSAFFILSPKVFIADVVASMSRYRGDDGTAATDLPYRKIIHSMRKMLLHWAAHMIVKYSLLQQEMSSAGCRQLRRG
jgi:hypothetical protein